MKLFLMFDVFYGQLNWGNSGNSTLEGLTEKRV